MAGTDGLVPVAAQHGVGSAAAALTGIGNLGLPAAFDDAHLPGGAPDGAGRIFVRTAIGGTSAWPGETGVARRSTSPLPGCPPSRST